MNICFETGKFGQVCLGDVTAQLHGPAYGMTHAGMAILAIIGLAITVFVFRDPA